MESNTEITIKFARTQSVENDSADSILENLDHATGNTDGATIKYDQEHWEGYDGQLAAVLELIFSAPAFDSVDDDELEFALGNGIHAIISVPDQSDIIATSQKFDATEPVSRENCPVNVGDTIPLDYNPGTYEDWPTDGPLFIVHDDTEETTYAQVDPARDAFTGGLKEGK